MADFTPTTIYETRLPELKPGHILHIGPDFSKGFYQVTTVRHNPKDVALTGAKTDYRLYITTDASYESLHGSLERNRIVHIQYVSAANSAPKTKWYWGTQPLLSKDVDEEITGVQMAMNRPLKVDRWSYDSAMHLYLTQDTDQTYYFEVVEYTIVGYPGKPKTPYLHIMANGQAVFVEAEATELGLRRAELVAIQGLRKAQELLKRAG